MRSRFSMPSTGCGCAGVRGGHVVLPLLRDAVVPPGWISPNAFLTGYRAAQAVPGPLFTVAAYLGAALTIRRTGWRGERCSRGNISAGNDASCRCAAVLGQHIRTRSDAQAGMRGVNAAVVGILAAALYDPLWKSAIERWRDAVLALTGFAALTVWKVRRD